MRGVQEDGQRTAEGGGSRAAALGEGELQAGSWPERPGEGGSECQAKDGDVARCGLGTVALGQVRGLCTVFLNLIRESQAQATLSQAHISDQVERKSHTLLSIR